MFFYLNFFFLNLISYFNYQTSKSDQIINENIHSNAVKKTLE